MNNVIDEVLNTAATDNKIKYKIKHADNSEELVEISLATPVTTPGTPLNKLLFDSIQADITHLTPVTGNYSGNGNATNSHFANLGYVPKFVFIFGGGGGSYAESGFFINDGTGNTGYSAIAASYLNNDNDSRWYFKDSNGTGHSSLPFSITANGFSFGSIGSIRLLNNSGKKYSYVIFK